VSQAQTFRIGDWVYKVAPVPGRRGALLFRRVAALLAHMPRQQLEEAAALLRAGLGEASPQMRVLGIELVGRVAAALSDDDLEYVMRELSAASWFASAQTPDRLVPLTGDAMDAHFAAAYPRMLEWMGRGLLVNFPNFQSAFASLLEAARARAGDPRSPSPSTSTGSSSAP
jgi:hypothetical protein